MKKYSKNIQTILDVLQDEINGNTKAAFKKVTKDYTMTWVYKTKKELFPTEKLKSEKDIVDIYQIKGREYDIKNIAEGDNVVMLEMVESYPDPKTKRVYRTPLVIILEMKNGKIRTGRHYCDPDVSHLHLNKAQVKKAYKKDCGGNIILK